MKLEQFQWSAGAGWNRPLRSSSLACSAQLVLVFGRPELAAAEGLSAIRSAFPQAHVFGCSTGGEIQGNEVRDDTLAVTAIAFEHSRVATARATIGTVEESYAAGKSLVRQLEPTGLRHIFVVSEGLMVSSSDLVRGVAEAVGKGVTVSGGFAADGNRLQKTFVWVDGEPLSGAAAAIGFYGERLQIGVAVTGGWGPFGPDRLITKSRKNVLYEFDGRPALALYKQYLGEYAAGLPATGLMFPLEVRIEPGGNRVLRALLAVDEKEQSITFAGDVPEGSHARFMVGHIEDLIQATLNAAKSSCESLPGKPPQFSLIVSCNARRAVLKQRVDEEIEALREILGDQPVMTGFYSYGEIGPPQGGAGSELHNETMTITNFAET
jgi:hypothetical protein